MRMILDSGHIKYIIESIWWWSKSDNVKIFGHVVWFFFVNIKKGFSTYLSIEHMLKSNISSVWSVCTYLIGGMTGCRTGTLFIDWLQC